MRERDESRMTSGLLTQTRRTEVSLAKTHCIPQRVVVEFPIAANFHMGKPKLREVRQVPQDHTARSVLNGIQTQVLRTPHLRLSYVRDRLGLISRSPRASPPSLPPVSHGQDSETQCLL